MTITEKQLINARRACLVLAEFAARESALIALGPPHQELIGDLIEQFGRLDAKERRQKAAGKKGAAHGKKGGRPRKK